jgi:hypothetical protein
VSVVFVMEGVIMQRWRQSQKKNADEPDEHSAPTEPLLPVVEDSVPAGEIPPTEKLLPAPLSHEQTFPQQQAQDGTQLQGPSSPPAVPVYPVLPPAPSIQQGHRPVGSAPAVQPQKAMASTQSPIPLFVGIFFVAVQFLLLINFIARLISLPSYQQWLGVIYGISSIFLLPFRLLFEHVTLPFSLTIGVEVYTLLAILVYGLLSRLLVRLLKVLLRSR